MSQGRSSRCDSAFGQHPRDNIMKDHNVEDGGEQFRDHKDASAAKHDDHDMRRMGKTPELRRVFRQVSIMSLTCVIMATWEYLFTANSRGLLNGGPAGMIWSYIWTLTGFGLMVVSLAELSSMAPTSGGQYHWVSEFAPANLQKPLSYATGWLSIVSYQAGNASGFFLVGTIVQSLATANHPEYHSTSWQSTLCVLAAVLISGVCNIFLSQHLPIITNISMVVHIMAFFATTVVIWTFAPHPPAHAVILDILNSGGWPDLTVSLMVGQVCAIASLGCSDSASHMSEEVLDAGVSVPRAMIWSLAINGTMGLIFVFTFAFSVPSVNEALHDPSGYAFMWVFRTALRDGSLAGNILTTAVVFVLMSGNLAYTAVSARQIWSFARDEGLPWSAWLGKTGLNHAVPINATLVTLGCTILLSLINLVSTTALNAILSLQLSAMLATYAVCLACVSTAKVFRPSTVPQARWSLGRYGLPINILATLYATFACFWTFWPDHARVRVDNMNWAPVILAAVMLIASGLYFSQGRRSYSGPVVLVSR